MEKESRTTEDELLVEHESVKYWEKLRNKWSELSPEQKVYYSSFGILAAAHTVDLLTTSIGLTQEGISEQNPLGEFLYENGGVGALILLKASAMLVVIGGSEYARRSYDGDWSVEKIYGNALRLTNIFYVTVIVNNLLLLLDSFGHVNL